MRTKGTPRRVHLASPTNRRTNAVRRARLRIQQLDRLLRAFLRRHTRPTPEIDYWNDLAHVFAHMGRLSADMEPLFK